MRNNSFLFWLLLFVDGVLGADGVKIVSVMVGDSVTLRTDDTETQGAQELVWKIQDENKFLAEIDKEINTLSLPGNDEERFRGRLELDGETGSLTITNLNTTDSRVYELKIKYSKEMKFKIFNVTVRGVFSDEKDGVKTVSVKEGDPIHLHTHVTEIERDDPIEWTFGPQNIFIAKTDGKNKFISYNYIDARFKNKLHLNTDTADLTIKNSNSEHSGLYQLKIGNTTYTIQKRFSVNVSAHVLSILEIVLISVVALLLATAACFIIYKCRHRICKNSQEQRELNSHTAHSDVSADKDNEIRIPLQST